MSETSTKKFLVARIARLWPIHFVTFISFAILVQYGRHDAFGLQTILNLLLLHAWISKIEYTMSHNAVSWSISAEMFFYIMFPIFARSKNLRFGFMIFGLLIILIILIMNTLSTLADEVGWHSAIALTLVKNPFTNILEFILGMATCQIFLNYSPPKLTRAKWTFIEFIALSSLFFAVFFLNISCNLLNQLE